MQYVADANGNINKAIESREDVSVADKKRAVREYGNVKYADEKNKKYPIDTAEHVRAAASYWGMPKNRAKYSSEEQRIISKRIAAAKKKFGVGNEAQKSKLVVTDDVYLLLKSRRKGKPKSDVERVMNHYGVDEETARKMLAKKSADELLPERGAGLKKSQKVKQPGKRGGKYWIDKHGNVRYGARQTEKDKKKLLVIDEKLSEKYNIGRYGKRGMEIIPKDGGRAIIFNKKPTDRENWLDAVKYAKRLEEKKEKGASSNKSREDKYQEVLNKYKSGKRLTIRDIYKIVNSVEVVPYKDWGKSIKFTMISDSRFDDNIDNKIKQLVNDVSKKLSACGLEYKKSDILPLHFDDVEDVEQRRVSFYVKKPARVEKSLTLPYTGAEIIEGIDKKIADYQKQVNIAKKLNEPHSWEDSQVKRLQVLKTKINSSKEYKITPDDMDRYGLIKGVLTKSLEIEFKGNDIKAGINKVLASIRKKEEILKKDESDKPYDEMYRKKRLEKIKSLLKDDEIYELDPYEMEEYGLLKSLPVGIRKSIEFEVSGQRIRESLLGKIAELRGKMAGIIERLKSGQDVQVDQSGSEIGIFNKNPEKRVNPEDSWEVKVVKNEINRMERIIRNIDVNKKFKLDSYELEKYGL